MPTVAELSVDIDANDRATVTLERLDELLRRLEGSDASIPINADADDATEDIRFIQDALFDLEQETVSIPIDTTGIAEAEAELQALQDELDKLENQINIGLDLDMGQAEAQLAALKAQLEDLQSNPVNIDLDFGAAVVKIAELEALLASIPDETVTIEVDVDRDGQITDRLKNITAAASRASTQVSALAMAILVLGPTLAPLLGAAAFAVGGLAVGLAGAAAGAALFAGVAVTNFKPIAEVMKRLETLQKQYDKAVTDKQKLDVLDKMKTAIDSLDPSQRAMFEGITAVQSAWSDFATQFRPEVFTIAGRGLQIIAQILPTLAPLMQGMLIAVQNLQDSLISTFSNPAVQKFAKDISNIAGPVFEMLMKGLGNILVGFLGILNAFIPFSAGVSGGFVKMTAAFAQWGMNLANNPGFKSFISFVQSNMPLVIGFVKSLWSAMVELVKAMAPLGVGVLAGVKGLLDAITWLGQQHPKILTFILAVLAIGAAFFNLLGPVLAFISVFSRIGAIFGVAGGWVALIVVAIAAVVAALVYAYTHFEGFRNVVNSVFQFVVSAVQAAIPYIVAGFQQLMQWGQQAWSWLVSTFGPAIATVVQFVVTEFQKFSQWFQDNKVILTALWQAILQELQGVWSLIVNVVKIAAQFVVDFVSGAWGGLVNIVRGLWSAISGVISGALQIVRGVIQVFAAVVSGDWGAFWGGLGQIVQGAWTAIGGIVVGAVQIVIGIFQILWAAVVAIWNALWNTLKAILQPTIDWIKEVWQNVYDFLVGNSIIPDLVNGIIQWFTTLVTNVTSIFTAIWTFLQTIWTNIYTWVSQIVMSIYTYISERLTAIKTVWETIWNTVWTFIQTIWNNIVTWITDMVTRIVQSITQFVTDVKQKWDQFWTDFLNVIIDNAKKVIQYFVDLGTNIVKTITDIGSKMLAAGKALVQGLIDGIESMLGALGNTADKIAKKVTDVLPGSPAKIGPLSGSGYSLLRGQRMVQDFASGIQSQAPMLGMTMRDLADLATLNVSSDAAYGAITSGTTITVAPGAVQVSVGAGADGASVKAAVGQAGTDLATQIQDALRRR